MGKIQVENINKTFRNFKRAEGIRGGLKNLFHRDYFSVTAVKDISFEVGQGELVGYLGPNGAGQSALIPYPVQEYHRAFWFLEISYFMWAKNFIINFLSGMIIPIAFFPSWLSAVALMLPFHACVNLPLQIYLGRFTPQEIIASFLTQLAWLAFFHFSLHYIAQGAYRRLEVQGG